MNLKITVLFLLHLKNCFGQNDCDEKYGKILARMKSPGLPSTVVKKYLNFLSLLS